MSSCEHDSTLTVSGDSGTSGTTYTATQSARHHDSTQTRIEHPDVSCGQDAMSDSTQKSSVTPTTSLDNQVGKRGVCLCL